MTAAKVTPGGRIFANARLSTGPPLLLIRKRSIDVLPGPIVCGSKELDHTGAAGFSSETTSGEKITVRNSVIHLKVVANLIPILGALIKFPVD